jgi:hypothetical protein
MSGIDVKFDKLHNAVEWSIKQLATPRKKRVEAIKQFVGSHYSDGGAEQRVPTNFIELAVTIYTRQLAARAPRVLITTGVQNLRPMAKDMEIALNQIPGEIGLGNTLRSAVVDAMFSFAVVKVGISRSDKAKAGETFVDLVSLDDYFVDMSAKGRGGVQFEGNDYWLPIEDARAMYDGDPKDIQPDDHTVVGDQGQERAEAITSSEGADIYGDRVWMRDVYIPRTNKMITYGVKSLKVFREIEFDGPDHGPYYTLGFSDVPGNLLPLPPVALWRDLHELGNNLFRRLGRQSEAKKTVASFQGGNDEDVQALKRASDGDGIKYNGAKPEAITVGGIDAPTLAFYLQIRDLFSYFAGNLDTLGGLGSQSDTVGQEKLISEASSARMQSMGEATINFAREIFKALAWYEWTDPIRERKIKKPVKGTDIAVSSVWSAETRDGDFLDYNLDIDVYSMQDDSPSSKLQKVGTALERFVFPILPQIEAQGGQIDAKALLGMIGELANIPELADIVKFVEPDPNARQQRGNGEPTHMPANTKRTYERVSRSAATRAGKDDVMSRLLMGGKVQPKEGAMLDRRAS